MEEEPRVTQKWLSTEFAPRRFMSRFARGEAGRIAREQHEWKKSKYRQIPRQPLCLGNDLNASRDQIEFCRRNGFQLPLNAFQVLSWVFFVVDVILGVVFLPSVYPRVGVLTFYLSFGLACGATVVIAAIVTRIDPSDPLVFMKGKRDDLYPNKLSCDLCGAVSKESRHCRSCNKCIARFDHHCMWLNNCIGEINYKWFLALVGCVAILSLIVIVSAAFTIWLVYFDNEGSSVYYDPIIMYIMCGLLLLINIPLFGLDLQLAWLHLYLVYKNWTTFEYITQRVQPRGSSESVCCDWIIIDRARLRRARERWRRRDVEGAANESVPRESPLIYNEPVVIGSATGVMELQPPPVLSNQYHATSIDFSDDESLPNERTVEPPGM